MGLRAAIQNENVFVKNTWRTYYKTRLLTTNMGAGWSEEREAKEAYLQRIGPLKARELEQKHQELLDQEAKEWEAKEREEREAKEREEREAKEREMRLICAQYRREHEEMLDQKFVVVMTKTNGKVKVLDGLHNDYEVAETISNNLNNKVKYATYTVMTRGDYNATFIY
jgi:inorganic pyrophosphatase/exopolyphosphatase